MRGCNWCNSKARGNCIVNGTITTNVELAVASTYSILQNINNTFKAKVPIRATYTVGSITCDAKGSIETNNTLTLIPLHANIPSGTYIEFLCIYVCE